MLRYGQIFHLGNLYKIEGYEDLRSISERNHSIVWGIKIDTLVTLVTDKGVFEFKFVEDSTVLFTNSGLILDRLAFIEFEESILFFIALAVR